MPKGIRPTQSKVRKAIFDILGDVEGLSFLELFAGSGAVGFEALSYGAKKLVLVEAKREAQLMIKKNIEALKVTACQLYPYDWERALENLSTRQKSKFDIIFLDPPYHQDLAKKTLLKLSTYDILTPAGLVVIQHGKKDILPDALGVFGLVKRAIYGDTVLSLYTHKDIS